MNKDLIKIFCNFVERRRLSQEQISIACIKQDDEQRFNYFEIFGILAKEEGYDIDMSLLNIPNKMMNEDLIILKFLQLWRKEKVIEETNIQAAKADILKSLICGVVIVNIENFVLQKIKKKYFD